MSSIQPPVGITPRPSDALPLGATLQDGAYRVGKVLGRGGFGITYIGADTHLKRPVAIKEFFLQDGYLRQGNAVVPAPNASPAALQSARDQFLREAQALARFDHPGIVRVHSVFAENATAYMVMELLRGQTLREQIEKNGPLSEPETLIALGFIGEALRAVHEVGLLHRDLNPSNIIDCDTRMVLIDFGLTRPVDDTSSYATRQLSQTTSLGTQGFAPIEQYGKGAISQPATDIYALGATAYYLLTGKVPVTAVARAAGDALPSPHDVNASISQELSHAVMAAMEMDIAKRPQSVREFLAACTGSSSRTLASTPVTATTPQQSHPAATLPPVAHTSPPATVPSSVPSSPAVSPTKQQTTAVYGSEIEVPQSFILCLDAPGVPAYFQDMQVQWPTVVRVSARVLNWPYQCPCCGSDPNTSLHRSSIVKGIGVIKQPTDSWRVPFCDNCSRVFRLTRQLPEMRKKVSTKQGIYNFRRKGSVKPPSDQDEISSDGCGCLLTGLAFSAITLTLAFTMIPREADEAIQKQGVAACFLVSTVVMVVLYYIKWWLYSSPERRAYGFLKELSEWIVGTQKPATHQPSILPPPASSVTNSTQSGAQSQAIDNSQEQQAYDEWQAAQAAVASAENDIAQWSQQVGMHPRYAVAEWRKLGSVHTYLFLNSEYARQFAAANQDKVVFNEPRAVVFDYE